MVVLESTGIEACIQSRPYVHHVPEGEGVIVDILTLPYLIPLQFASFFLSFFPPCFPKRGMTVTI